MTLAKPRSIFTSLGIILAALGLTYAPLPGVQQTLVVVAGTELQEALQALETSFEQDHPHIDLDLQFQGSQELADRYLDQRNDFNPAVLIPANGEILTELSDRWRTQIGSEPFYDPPRPIARTLLVGIAWPERGKRLFPDGRFQWQRLEQALAAETWGALGGPAAWGSFDLVITDPIRSNSGQLTLSLWSQSKLGGNLGSPRLNSPVLPPLFDLVKRSVYQPPRSTDILLQEFISRGSNDADVATVYESIALYRWQQAAQSRGRPYQIYYLTPTIETVSTAAIVRREIEPRTADAARTFLEFLTAPAQQAVLVQHGFRPVNAAVDVRSIANSPWRQNIPGAEVSPPGQRLPPPEPQVLTEINRLWERAN